MRRMVVCLAVASGCHAQPSDSDPPSLSWPEPGDGTPLWLSQTGLYDRATALPDPELLPFAPTFALWSDGTDKRRWVRLPAGGSIDTTDMDHWRFPVGTVFIKEFAVDDRRLETRVSVRTGPEPRDLWMGAFVWNDEGTDALYVPDGVRDVAGTDHDVPAAIQCVTCHAGEPSGVLGFSAVQRPRVGPKWPSDPPPQSYAVPGDALTARALGYLHANCGHCHNPNGSARPDTEMELRLSVRDRQVETTAAVRTTVGLAMRRGGERGATLRIDPGQPQRSGLWRRLARRDPGLQMPPLGTERVDLEGVAVVRAWIESM